MPPHPLLFEGIADFQRLLERAFGPRAEGDWRLRADRPPTASRRPPATCARPATTPTARSSSTCCASQDGRIAEITTFDAALFEQFGLPPTL